MRKLGKKGRFANQLFQYAYLRQESGGDYQCPRWMGQLVYNLDDKPPTRGTPELSYKFPLHSSYYNKDLFQSLFKTKSQLKQMLDTEISIIKKRRILVGVHLRRGDFGTFKRKSARWCFVAPVEWYVNWLDEHNLHDPLVFIASEEACNLWKEFPDRYTTFYWPNKNFYWDFYTLTQCDYLLISNSSFGFAASMLNNRAKGFYRPRLSERKLIEYDPWNAPLVFKDERY